MLLTGGPRREILGELHPLRSDWMSQVSMRALGLARAHGVIGFRRGGIPE